MTTQTKLSRKDQLKLIDDVFYKIARAMDYTMDFDKYEYQAKIEEKAHRKTAPYNVRHGISVNVATRYFVVNDLISAIERTPKIEDALFLRVNVLYAYSLQHKYKEIKRILTPEIIEAFKTVDYAFLMQAE